MILGVGIDLIEIMRVEKMLNSSTGDRFVRRVLTEAEQKLAENRKNRLPEFVAGRFAAKEAVVKALGCGIGEKVGFHDIEVLPDSLGKPICTLSQEARDRLGLNASTLIHLSITHSETMAGAYVMVEQTD